MVQNSKECEEIGRNSKLEVGMIARVTSPLAHILHTKLKTT